MNLITIRKFPRPWKNFPLCRINYFILITECFFCHISFLYDDLRSCERCGQSRYSAHLQSNVFTWTIRVERDEFHFYSKLQIICNWYLVSLDRARFPIHRLWSHNLRYLRLYFLNFYSFRYCPCFYLTDSLALWSHELL